MGARGGAALEEACGAAAVPFVGGFRFGRGAGRLLHLPADARRLLDAVRELQLDVVHVHRSDDQLLARLAFRHAPGAVLVRTWHRDPARVAGPLRRRAARACAGCVCVARAHAEALRAAGAARVEYVPPGVDTERFRPRPDSPLNKPPDFIPPGLAALSHSGERANNGLPQQQTGGGQAPQSPTAAGPPAFIFGQIGRWKEQEDRGQRAFLEVTQLLDRGLNWRGVLLGRGEGRGGLERSLAHHPAAERLSLVETTADFPAQVAGLDLGLVFAAGSDGTSRAAVELLACGVPVFLAGLPGLRELGEDPACARVLPPGEPAAWARACAELLADRVRLAAMKAAARARAEKVHALPVHGAALVEFYGQLAQGMMAD